MDSEDDLLDDVFIDFIEDLNKVMELNKIKGNKVSKENKKDIVGSTKNFLNENCDELNKLEDFLSNFEEVNSGIKEGSSYSTDNYQELRKVLFKNTSSVLNARYNEIKNVKSVLANILDRNFNIKIDINAFKKNKKLFAELEKFDAAFDLFVYFKNSDGELIEEIKDPFTFDFRNSYIIENGIVKLKLKASIFVYHYFWLLKHLDKDCDKNPLDIISLEEKKVIHLKERFIDEINDLDKEIKKSLIDNVDPIKFNKQLSVNMIKYRIFNQFYENLTENNIQLLDFDIVDIFNFYKEKAKIVLVDKGYNAKQDEVFALFEKDCLYDTAFKELYNQDNEQLEKFKALGIEFESIDVTKSKIREDLTFLGGIMLNQGMNFAVSCEGFISKFLPEIEQPCKYKKWFSKSDLYKLTNSVTEGNKDLVKTMTNRLKNKDIIKVQLINGQRKHLNVLKQEFPNYNEVIKFIDDYLTIQEKTTGEFYFPPILLDGEPGIGKTFFLTKLAKIFNVESHIENMASVSTGARFTGTEAHWSNCNIGMLLQLMLTWKYANGIILLDEIDKVRMDNHNGPSPIVALLPILERATSDKFMDVSLDLAFDTSNFIWTASSNNTDKMHPALLSRFNIFKIKTPNKEERKILTKAIYKQLLLDNTWNNYFSQDLDEDVIEKIVEELDGGSARKTRRILQEALANAASDNSNKLKVQHLIDRPESKTSIGFMN